MRHVADSLALEVDVQSIEIVGHRFVKIGKTTNVDTRFSQLQTASPFDLRFIDIIEGDHESKIHELLAAQRVRGEWFVLDAHVYDVLRLFDAAPQRFFPWRAQLAAQGLL